MSDIKCPMCTDCPDNCPLDNKEDTRKYSADYYKGKADAIDELAEWVLCNFAPLFTKEELIKMFSEQMQKGAESK